MRYPETRFARRLAKRRAAAEPSVKFGPADPRGGDDRRQAERRDTSLTPEQIADRLRELGISDRRGSGDRRQRARRR